MFVSASDETLARIKSLVSHAYDYVPFYRERMNAYGLTLNSFQTLEDFEKFPPTTKADLTANFPDLITASKQDFTPWRYASTSGTIERLTVVQDFRKRDCVRAAQLLALNSASGYHAGMKYMEIPPDICTNVCGASDTVDPPLYRYLLDNTILRTFFR